MSTYFGFTPSNQSGSYFISYNSEDAERVAPIAFAMRQSGVPLWYDQGLVAGEQWEKQIVEHIASCKAVIMFVTKKLMQRERLSYVRLEYNLATNSENNKKVYIALLDDIEVRDVNIQHKIWWQRIMLLQCIKKADADRIMTAIGFGSGEGAAPSETSLSADELCQQGIDYHYGNNGKPQDYSMSIKFLRLAADQGYAAAQYNLGVCYEKGLGVTQDYEIAKKYYCLAADQGYTMAQYNLGGLYYWGLGVPQDDRMAVKYYRLAADQGDASAQYNLGICYETRRGVPQDYEMAVKYYSLAANQGYVGAQFNLGVCYYFGRGVPQDYRMAVKYYRLAADQGLPEAQYNLGVCYHFGHGVPQDYRMAVKYYRVAADQGFADAQNNLGVCYEDGQGVAKDRNNAIRLYRHAAEAGNEKAKQALARLGGQ